MPTVTRYEPGQVWRYRTRPGEEASRVGIVKVDSDPKLGHIIHIMVMGLALKNPAAPGGISQSISHLPYLESGIDASVTDLESSGVALSGWEGGYDHWKKPFDEGKAGVWSIPVEEAIAAMEQALSQE